jgi:hypothetical protein
VARLRASSKEDVQLLLELFPLSALKSNWTHFKGNKQDICEKVAEAGDSARVASFVAANFARCKQHIYAFQPADDAPNDFRRVLPNVDVLADSENGGTVFLGVSKYTVLLRDPFSMEEIELLWPMRFQQTDRATILSFVILERDVRPLFDREVVNVRRHLDEKDIILQINAAGHMPLDLNKGVKRLWREDYMDAFRSKFKKARSTTTEAMDREQGIKATNRDLYDEMMVLPMFETLFRTNGNGDRALDVFQINPSAGSLRMMRYSDGASGSDELVQRILQKNR